VEAASIGATVTVALRLPESRQANLTGPDAVPHAGSAPPGTIGVKTGGGVDVAPLPSTHQYAKSATPSVALDPNCTVIGFPTTALPLEVTAAVGMPGLCVTTRK